MHLTPVAPNAVAHTASDVQRNGAAVACQALYGTGACSMFGVRSLEFGEVSSIKQPLYSQQSVAIIVFI